MSNSTKPAGETPAPIPDITRREPYPLTKVDADPKHLRRSWLAVLNNPDVRVKLRRARRRMPEAVSMAHLVGAMILAWDDRTGKEKMMLVAEAMGINSDAIENWTLTESWDDPDKK
jgi:hypothetical protein